MVQEAQYEVVFCRLTNGKEDPVAMDAPPTGPANQFTTPEQPLAEIVRSPGPQREAGTGFTTGLYTATETAQVLTEEGSPILVTVQVRVNDPPKLPGITSIYWAVVDPTTAAPDVFPESTQLKVLGTEGVAIYLRLPPLAQDSITEGG